MQSEGWAWEFGYWVLPQTGCETGQVTLPLWFSFFFLSVIRRHLILRLVLRSPETKLWQTFQNPHTNISCLMRFLNRHWEQKLPQSHIASELLTVSRTMLRTLSTLKSAGITRERKKKKPAILAGHFQVLSRCLQVFSDSKPRRGMDLLEHPWIGHGILKALKV